MGAKPAIVGRVPWKYVISGLGLVAAIIGIWQFIVDPMHDNRKKQDIFSEMAKRIIEDEPQYIKVYEDIVKELPSRIQQTEDKMHWEEFEIFWTTKIDKFDAFHKSMWEAAIKGEVLAGASERAGPLCRSVAKVLATHSEVDRRLASLYGVLVSYKDGQEPVQTEPVRVFKNGLPVFYMGSPVIHEQVINDVSGFVTVVSVPRFRYLPAIYSKACGAADPFIEPSAEVLRTGLTILRGELTKACRVVRTVREENEAFIEEEFRNIGSSVHDDLLSNKYRRSTFAKIGTDLVSRLEKRGSELARRHDAAENFACKVARVLGEVPVCFGDVRC